jgi:hypothetical protein
VFLDNVLNIHTKLSLHFFQNPVDQNGDKRLKKTYNSICSAKEGDTIENLSKIDESLG